MSQGLSTYRVRPGSRVDLRKWDPDDRSASPGTKPERERRLHEIAAQIDELQDVLYAEHKRGVLIVLQGMDTSGKDGTIRHVFAQVDPLGVSVAAFKQPTAEEAAHDFLWRVHEKVPGKGEIVIFNRSHYEDVLVVRVHKLITPAECERRYEQIREFEELLVANGTVVMKFFLHISKDEQKRRLQERLDDPKKQWKFNVGDLSERKLWRDYTKAYTDALTATSTAAAPWYIVPANSKTNRNMVVSLVLRDTLKAMKLRYPRPAGKLNKVVIE